LKQNATSKEVFEMKNYANGNVGSLNGTSLNSKASAGIISPDVSTAGGRNPPVKRFKAGAIIATVWTNEGTSKDGSPVPYSTVSIDRNYKDKNGEWQKTTSMRLNDLPKAALVASKAYEYLVLNGGIKESETDIYA